MRLAVHAGGAGILAGQIIEAHNALAENCALLCRWILSLFIKMLDFFRLTGYIDQHPKHRFVAACGFRDR